MSLLMLRLGGQRLRLFAKPRAARLSPARHCLRGRFLLQ
jgi:hypothetical protein